MSTAEELLASLSLDSESETEAHIVIGKNRNITVPKELKRLAVQHDHNIETVTFDCPRYWDDTDMSVMRVYINYVRSDKVPGCYAVESVTIDETDSNIMHFDWTISRNVTDAAGNIKFQVCTKQVDDEGNEEEHWNSELCHDCYVSEGLECGESITIKYPDIISQLEKEIDSKIDTALENITVTSDYIVIGSDEPYSGPILWFDTGPQTSSENIVMLDLGGEGDESAVIASIDGNDNPVTNAYDPTEVDSETVEITVT